jgi:hypothetical protein
MELCNSISIKALTCIYIFVNTVVRIKTPIFTYTTEEINAAQNVISFTALLKSRRQTVDSNEQVHYN